MAGHPLAEWLEASGDGADGEDADDEVHRASAGALGARSRPRRRRLALLVAGAAASWAVVAIALLLGGDDEEAAEAIGQTAGTSPPGAALDQPADSAVSPTGADVPAEQAAAAVVGARTEVARMAEATGRNRYVDVAVAERAERAGDHVVVTVLAVVLEGEDGVWTSERVQRLAVPLRADPGGAPALAGSPWALPAPAGAGADGPTWTDDEEPAPGVAEALGAAGFAGVADLATARADQAPLLRASFTADHPPGRHEVWLTEGPDIRVLGGRARHDMKGGH